MNVSNCNPSEGFLRRTAAADNAWTRREDIMPLIEAYSFGRMVIDGSTYARDVIIYPDNRILCPWWREQGHRLAVADITDLIAMQPDSIVAGTGASGLMLPDAALVRLLAEKKIEFIALPTDEAVRTFNSRSGREKAGGCFHLTC